MFGGERFHATAAQVLRTPLVAIAVEGGLPPRNRPEGLYVDVRRAAEPGIPGGTILRRRAHES